MALDSCGWPNKKYHYLSWVLSALQFRKYYDQVELVTDEFGAEVLVNKLGLPYTSVKVILDEINGYDSGLYAMGKIKAYSVQDGPFVHADGDIFIWDRLDSRLEYARLMCQGKEEGPLYNRMYMEILYAIAANFEYYPAVLDWSVDKNGGVRAINAGILGGHDNAFFAEYANKAFEFIDRNLTQLQRINPVTFNLIFEQFLFAALAEQKGVRLEYLNSEVNLSGFFCEYTGVPTKTKYIHPCGPSKKNRHLVDWLECQVRNDYPEYYYRVMHLIKSNEI